MTAYVYVLSAVEDGIIKVGKSKQLKQRLSVHSGNSSNPLRFELRQLYQFSTFSEAHKVEQLALKRLAKQGLSYRGKRELFKCTLAVAMRAIELSCAEAGTSPLKNFPLSLNEVLDTFDNFPCLPEYALELFNSDQRRTYWKGVEDAILCLSYMEGVKVSRRDFLELWNNVRERKKINSELWTTIIDHYRNEGMLGADKSEKEAAEKVAWAALEKIKADRRFAYIDWQEIDDDDEVA